MTKKVIIFLATVLATTAAYAQQEKRLDERKTSHQGPQSKGLKENIIPIKYE